MNRLKAFVRLDFITIKPFFNVKTLMIYAFVAIMMTAMSANSANSANGISTGMLFATLFIGFPFSLGEKSRLDALYATLSVSRKTVVLGRYIFALILNVCAMLLFAGLGMAVSLAAGAGREPIQTGGAVATALALSVSAFFLFIQSIQLPLYFKLGYTKARFLSVIPFGAVFASSFVISAVNHESSGPPEFLANAWNSGMFAPLLAAALLAVVFVSYRLSLAFYKKREF